MKKLFLLLSICAISFTMMASNVTSIIVTKSHGGLTAIFNLYNSIVYTPAQSNNMATLNCYGSGFSFCRVPTTTLAPTNNGTAIDANTYAQIIHAINDLIEMSETEANNGVLNGQQSKKIAVQSTTHRGFDTYCIKGVWNYQANGDGTMRFTVSTTDILNRL